MDVSMPFALCGKNMDDRKRRERLSEMQDGDALTISTPCGGLRQRITRTERTAYVEKADLAARPLLTSGLKDTNLLQHAIDVWTHVSD